MQNAQVTECRSRDDSGSSEEREKSGTARVGDGELPGPTKGRIPRDPPQRGSGNRGRALMGTRNVGGKATAEAAMCEKLDLQSGGGRVVVGVEEQMTSHHQMPNAGGHLLEPWGRWAAVPSIMGTASVAMRGGLIRKFPLGAMHFYCQV